MLENLKGATPLLRSLHSQEVVTVGQGRAVADALFPTSQGCLYAVCHLSVHADVLRFDNTYSLLHTKKVSYTVEVLLPDKACEEKLQGFGSTDPPQDSEDSGRL